MDFQLTQEQQMLRDSVAAALSRVSDGNWGRAFADAGVLGVLVPEQGGGIGLGMVEVCLVAQAAGRRQVAFPIAETLAGLPAIAATDAGLSETVLGGSAALTAPASGALALVGDRLLGEIKVPYLDPASHIVAPLDDRRVAVLAASGLPARACARLGLFASNADIHIDMAASAATIVEDRDFVARLALLRAAEMAGAARFCFETAVQYLKDRSQFGRPIGANQAMKHMAADNFVRMENIRVALEYACAAHDLATAQPRDGEAKADAAQALQVLLAYVPEAARLVAEDAMQMHGGIGVTWEYALNAPLRRILRLGAALGASETHRRDLAADLSRPVSGHFSFGAAAE
jgi:alkylation response protein AidB-like acyl-CoA dehydrogenase